MKCKGGFDWKDIIANMDALMDKANGTDDIEEKEYIKSLITKALQIQGKKYPIYEEAA